MPRPKPGEIYQPHQGWSIRACKTDRRATAMSTGPVAQGRSCPQSGLPGAEEASLSASSHWGSHRLHPVVTPSAIGDAYFDKDRQIALTRLWEWMSERFSEIMRKHTRPGRRDVIDSLTVDDTAHLLGCSNKIKTIVGTAGASSADRTYVFQQLGDALSTKEVTPYQVLLNRSDLQSIEVAIKRILSRLLSSDSSPVPSSGSQGTLGTAAYAAGATATPIKPAASHARTPNTTVRRENNVDYSDDSDDDDGSRPARYTGKGQGGGVPLTMTVSEAVLGLLSKGFNDLSVLREWYRSTVHVQDNPPIVIMMEDADASNLATIEVLMELLVNLVRGEYDGMPGCFSAFPVTVILGVSGVSASDGGVMDLVRQMDEVLLVDEILLLDSTAVFEGFMDVIEIQMPALGFPLIASKQTVAILRDMFMNSRMCNEDVMRAICFIVRDYFDCNPWSVLCDPLVVTRAAGDAKKLSSAFASRLAGLSKMAREALAVHLKKEGCRGYTKADGCLDEAKASKHLGTLLGQRSKVAALALFWDALARTTAKKHTDKSARLEPYLFPEDEVGLRNDIERMCIAVEKLSGMSTVTFKSCVERTASWLEKSSRILPPECLDGHHGTELGDIIMFLKSLQNKVAPHGSAFPQASTVLTKHVSDLVTFIRQTLGAAVISTDLLPLRAAACEWDKSGELSDACLNVLDVDVFFDALGEADAIVDGEDRERSISEVPRDSSGKLPPGYSEKLSDLTIVYRQYLQHARTIDLEDLWTSFCEKVKDVEDPAPSSEDMKVRFGMCLCTLEFLGVIQPPSRGSLMKGQDPSRFFKGLRVKKLYFVDPQNSTKKAATEDVIMEDGEGENEGDDRGTKPNASSKKRAASAKKATPRSTAKRGRASRILYL